MEYGKPVQSSELMSVSAADTRIGALRREEARVGARARRPVHARVEEREAREGFRDERALGLVVEELLERRRGVRLEAPVEVEAVEVLP